MSADNCPHESVTVDTIETVSQIYYPETNQWDRVIHQSVDKLVSATCDDCGADTTEWIARITNIPR